jgi:hypothetical protein
MGAMSELDMQLQAISEVIGEPEPTERLAIERLRSLEDVTREYFSLSESPDGIETMMPDVDRIMGAIFALYLVAKRLERRAAQ